MKGQESVVELVRKEGRRRRGEEKEKEKERPRGVSVYWGGSAEARKAARQKEINPGKGQKGQRQPPKKS